MRRGVLGIVIALLTFSASGVAAFVVTEPCGTFEGAGRDHGDCPPTCVTCGCCAQAAEPVAVVVSVSPDVPVSDLIPVLPRVPRSNPLDILHVPKPVLA